MQDIMSFLTNLHRPRLLIRAARIGVIDYNREPLLRRFLGVGSLPRSGQALMRLIEIESELNDQRIEKNAGYSVIRHVEVMIALMGEARIYRATHP